MNLLKLPRAAWPLSLCLSAVVLVAGCADTNNNGQPDSVAPGVGAQAERAADSAVDATKDAARKAEPALEKAGEALINLPEAAVVTPAIKSAFLNNPSLKNTKIDVDTLGSKDTIALRGTVQNAAQKNLAERIAKNNAKGYKIANQLKVKG